MEVKYPSSKCEVNGAHYYIEASSLSGIFQCKYCKVVKWQPVYWTDAVRFSDLIKRQGLDKAYNASIGHRKKTRNIIIALSEISGLVISEEVGIELRKENVESPTGRWIDREVGDTYRVDKDKKMGKKKRKKYIKH